MLLDKKITSVTNQPTLHTTYLQPAQVDAEDSREQDQLQEGVTDQPDQSYDTELLQHVVEEDNPHADHGDQSDEVTGDGPALFAQTHSYTIFHLVTKNSSIVEISVLVFWGSNFQGN